MKLSAAEVQERLAHLNGWSVVDGKLQKKYRFKRFLQSVDFVNRIAQAAEDQDHHPDIFISFNQVTLYFMTHEFRGITERDFRGAQHADGLAAQAQQ